MTTLVVVGSTTTKYVSSGDGRRLMVTPRDYHWMDGHVCSEARKKLHPQGPAQGRRRDVSLQASGSLHSHV
ncbi:cobalamin biosynthesis protein CbiG [Cutibacterium acnes JCM 18916]|nr:cobalamin biosynthesis protein CbiG [Cutibacterium acnes JCM 18916]